MTASAPPRVLWLLRRASERKVWSGTSPFYAAAIFIERVAELSMESEGGDLRADAVLAWLLRD
jgi:hypothetical protein